MRATAFSVGLMEKRPSPSGLLMLAGIVWSLAGGAQVVTILGAQEVPLLLLLSEARLLHLSPSTSRMVVVLATPVLRRTLMSSHRPSGRTSRKRLTSSP